MQYRETIHGPKAVLRVRGNSGYGIDEGDIDERADGPYEQIY